MVNDSDIEASLFAAAYLLMVSGIPVAILIFVRDKKRGQATTGEKAELSNSNNSHTAPSSPIDHAQSEVKTTRERNLKYLLLLSLFAYICALISPLGDIKIWGGLLALTLGIFLFPLFWAPNPLFFAGWALAMKGRYQLAMTFGLIATIWATVVVSGAFTTGAESEIYVTGIASGFWIFSKLILVIACITGIICSKR